MSEGRHSFVAFYPSDWLGGTARMTRLHRSVYFDICCYVWDKADACPATELPLMLGDLPNWKELVQGLVDAGKVIRNHDGSVYNIKALTEGRKALDLWERKSSGGKRGAAKTNSDSYAIGRAHAYESKSDLFESPDDTPDGSPDPKPPKKRESRRESAGSPDAEPEPELDKIQSTESNPTRTCAPAREGDGRLDDRDLKVLLDACSEASGFYPTSTGQIDKAYAVVEAWRTAGMDFDNVVLPTIRSLIGDSGPKDTTSSLNRFNKAVQHEHARRNGSKSNGKTYRAPPAPVFEITGEDPKFIQFRHDLAAALTPALYAIVASDQVSFEAIDDRPIVRINGPNATRLRDGETGIVLKRVAKRHGFTDVW